MPLCSNCNAPQAYFTAGYINRCRKCFEKWRLVYKTKHRLMGTDNIIPAFSEEHLNEAYMTGLIKLLQDEVKDL